jgi:predicted nucleic acid-binding protein
VILVDTSVWIDHLRTGDAALSEALDRGRVACHPIVIGELACSNLRDRALVLELLGGLPEAPVATAAEVLAFIDTHALMGRGLGYVDVHLLAAAKLGVFELWSWDRSLNRIAIELGIAGPGA